MRSPCSISGSGVPAHSSGASGDDWLDIVNWRNNPVNPATYPTPAAELWFSVNNFTSAPFTWAETRGCLQTNHTKPPPAGFGGGVRRSRAITKKNMPFCMPFCTFFYVQPKCSSSGAIFVNSEGLRPCLSKPSYGASQWALMVRLTQKERPKSPLKSPFQKTRPFGSF